VSGGELVFETVLHLLTPVSTAGKGQEGFVVSSGHNSKPLQSAIGSLPAASQQ
jgi:hypothetical protein